MDLLAGYYDEGENSQTPEKKASGDLYGSPKEGNLVGVPPPANLDSEWENFEKLLADSSYGGGDSTSADIQIDSTGYKISEDDDRTVPKAYSITRSRSRSKSRSRSHSSGSSASSRSSSADSQKGKAGKQSSSSSDEAPDKEKSAASEKTDAQEKASSRSPPILRKERSVTPVEIKKSKSRSPERRKGSRHRSRSRSRSRGRHSHGRSSRRHRRSRSRGHEGSSRSSKSKHHRRSRSRDHHRHSRRRKSHDRSRSRDRHEKRDHHRRRHRSRSHGRDGRKRSPKRDHDRYRDEKNSTFRGGHEPTKPTFKEKMRQQLMKASKLLTDQAKAGQLLPDGERPLVSPKEKPSALPLNFTSGYPNMANAGTVTPQMALLQTMAVMHQKAQEMTGIAVPKYYNPAAVNPLKYAEQVQKRKLLWSKSKEKNEDTQAVWQGTNFNADNDGKVTAKFRKLMGMKEGEEAQEADTHADDINRKQQELFHKLDQQYEFARMTTHTHRGIGLGFQSQGMPDT